jgi:hypothetical protein
MIANRKFLFLCAMVFLQGYLSGVTIGTSTYDLLHMSLEQLASIEIHQG